MDFNNKPDDESGERSKAKPDSAPPTVLTRLTTDTEEPVQSDAAKPATSYGAATSSSSDTPAAPTKRKGSLSTWFPTISGWFAPKENPGVISVKPPSSSARDQSSPGSPPKDSIAERVREEQHRKRMYPQDQSKPADTTASTDKSSSSEPWTPTRVATTSEVRNASIPDTSATNSTTVTNKQSDDSSAASAQKSTEKSSSGTSTSSGWQSYNSGASNSGASKLGGIIIGMLCGTMFFLMIAVVVDSQHLLRNMAISIFPMFVCALAAAYNSGSTSDNNYYSSNSGRVSGGCNCYACMRNRQRDSELGHRPQGVAAGGNSYGSSGGSSDSNYQSDSYTSKHAAPMTGGGGSGASASGGGYRSSGRSYSDQSWGGADTNSDASSSGRSYGYTPNYQQSYTPPPPKPERIFPPHAHKLQLYSDGEKLKLVNHSPSEYNQILAWLQGQNVQSAVKPKPKSPGSDEKLEANERLIVITYKSGEKWSVKVKIEDMIKTQNDAYYEAAKASTTSDTK